MEKHSPPIVTQWEKIKLSPSNRSKKSLCDFCLLQDKVSCGLIHTNYKIRCPVEIVKPCLIPSMSVCGAIESHRPLWSYGFDNGIIFMGQMVKGNET